MSEPKWNKKKLEDLIKNQVQESLNLEYKRALAFGDNKENDITKDVSSFANSDGGVIIYGIKEFDDKDFKHLPEAIDPIDNRKYSKEWLEQKINLIRPKIEGVVIESVIINDNEVVYIVDIPKGTEAHQAFDKRYNKRYNFISVPMEDYEIRDINNRELHPNINVEFIITTEIYDSTDRLSGFPSPPLKLSTNRNTYLNVNIKNDGKIYAKYVSLRIAIPSKLKRNNVNSEKDNYIEFDLDNKFRYVTEYGMNSLPKTYSAYNFEPILPRCKLLIKQIEIIENYGDANKEIIKWSIFVDNAPMKNGEIKIEKIDAFIKDKTNGAMRVTKEIFNLDNFEEYSNYSYTQDNCDMKGNGCSSDIKSITVWQYRFFNKKDKITALAKFCDDCKKNMFSKLKRI